jgi:UDP-glucose 4-epimerase
VADIGAPETLVAPCQDVDVVINLASMSERACRLDPMGALRVNAGGTFGLASAAASAGARRFVQVSTYKVYGNALQGHVTEDTVCRPQSHYAITHRAAEDYVLSQHPNSVVLRLANGFGAPVDPAVDCWDIVANDFCRQAAVGRHIRIRSSGLAWRNFVPMEDVVRALCAAALELPANIYNLGLRQSQSLRDLAVRVVRVCQETLGFQPSVTCGPPGPDEVHQPLDYRIDRLAAAGFEASASFDAELSRTLVMAQKAFGPGPA